MCWPTAGLPNSIKPQVKEADVQRAILDYLTIEKSSTIATIQEHLSFRQRIGTRAGSSRQVRSEAQTLLPLLKACTSVLK
jgi:hypothetical protein